MEQWEAVTQAYPATADLRQFSKAVQTAGVVMREDLAAFEIEWITETLLFEPVALIATISSKRCDDTWSKQIGDAFKLLAEAVGSHAETFERHYEDIVSLCLCSYAPQIRKQALYCLAAIARRSATGAAGARRHIHALEETATCKAPLALLIGTICEFHPEVVQDDAPTIWRVYLNMLDCNKSTEEVTRSALQGILCLFTHFGAALPTAELNNFYDKMAADLLTMAKCEEVCLSILERHAQLFPERLSRDARARARLWRVLAGARAADARGAARAVRAVYVETCAVVDDKALLEIVQNELLPHTQSLHTQTKYTALRVVTHLQTRRRAPGALGALAGGADAHALEFELASHPVPYDTAEAVSYCIEANLPNSDKLLQTAVLFYRALPTSRRKEIVVHGILNSPPDIRAASVTFLTTESCLDAAALERHSELWRDLFDSRAGQDTVVVERARLVFEDFMGYVAFVLGAFLEDDVLEKLPTKLSLLLQLATLVLTLQPPEDFTADHCAILLGLLTEMSREYALPAEGLAALRAAGLHTGWEHMGDIWKTIRVDRCRDEALLCESCLTLVEAPPSAGNEEQVLMALQIIFSRNDVEPAMLSRALQKLENIILGDGVDLCSNAVTEIIQLVEQLHTRTDMTGKQARILHRDVLMFLGKYGNRSDSNLDTSDTLLIVKLEDMLVFNLPNPLEGTLYKINLKRLLHLAIMSEDPGALQALLVIICANLSARKHEALQLALARVVLGLARAHSRGAAVSPRAVQCAATLCDSAASVLRVLHFISSETSPGVRKMLSDALEALLTSEPGSPLSEALLSTVAEHAATMLRTARSTTRRAGLDISETLVTALKENNALTAKLLPNILELIAKTFETNSEIAFQIASKVYMEKIGLFAVDKSEDLVRNLIRILLENVDVKVEMDEVSTRSYKSTVKVCLEFVRNVYEYNKDPESKIVDTFLKVYLKQNDDWRSFYVLAEIGKVFELNIDSSRHLLSYECMFFVMKLLGSELRGGFCMEAVLRILEEYSDTLLELQYEKTLKFVAKVISTLTPRTVRRLHRNIKSCLSVYIKTSRNTPQVLMDSFENWRKSIPLQEISTSIEKDQFTSEHALKINALKTMLKIFNLTDLSVLTDLTVHTRKWPTILLKSFSTGYIEKYRKCQMSYLTDLLSVSIRFANRTEVKRLILEGCDLQDVSNEKVGIRFCRLFLSVFFELLIEEPFVLTDGDMGACCILVNDAVRYALRKKCTDIQYERILQLVDQLWPTYETHTTFDQKHALLLDMTNLPRKLGPESNPMRWACAAIRADGGSRGEKARLVGVLPGGDSFGPTYRAFASSLPTRLSEARGASLAALRSLIGALASTADLQLLEILLALGGGDDTEGWWDEAMESCMGALAARADRALCAAVYARCWGGLSLGVCRRAMVPLLRHSSSQLNEEFFASTMSELLATLAREQRVVTAQYAYQQSLADYTRALTILQVAFEKILPASLESPSSALYGAATPAPSQSWYLVRQTCKLGATLRARAAPPGALAAACRQFQCANYNCLAAAICRMRPNALVYSANVFSVDVWGKLVDCDVTPRLPLRSQWNQRTKRQPTSVDLAGGASARSALTAPLTRTQTRTRLFARTLSECALQYDLFLDDEPPEMSTQELQLPENELNGHECAATLAAVACHATTLPHTGWRDAFVSALTGDAHPNVKYLIAQTICNCKEELKPHASKLRPALLAFVADTASDDNGKRPLNGLHIDVLTTLTHWPDDSPQPSPHLDTAVQHLLRTCLENRQHLGVFTSLLDVLGSVLRVYGAVVSVSWEVFEPYVHETTAAAGKTFQVLKRVAKANIHIPELLPALIDKLEAKQECQQSALAELVGLALSAAGGEAGAAAARLRRVLARRGGDAAEYVRRLRWCQAGHAACCDQAAFRAVTDLVPKIVGVEKGRCLKILATYVEHNPRDPHVADMFDTVDICELVAGECAVEAMALVREGAGAMAEGLRRRVVMQVAGYCEHPLLKIRKAASDVMLKVFSDLSAPASDAPSAKKPRTSSSPITSAVDSGDVYRSAVLRGLARGARDGGAAEGVAGGLHAHMAVRFVESFIMCVYYPPGAPHAGASLLQLLLHALRTSGSLQRLRLSNQPLTTRQSNSAASKLLTMSSTYRGTFRTPALAARSPKEPQLDASTPDIDIQVTIDSVLQSLLDFAKESPAAADTFCVEFVKALLQESPGFDAGALRLPAVLQRGPGALTPLVLELGRLFVGDICKEPGLQSALQRLRDETVGTEAEQHVLLLCEEVSLRVGGHDQLVLGACSEPRPGGGAQADDRAFSLEDVTQVFGKLSNWDALTAQQRRVQSAGLPPLWTDRDNFLSSIKDFKGEGWLARMASALRGERRQEAARWLRDAARWPRRRFDVSATAEAVQFLRQEAGQFPRTIQPADCLAEWAARLMTRTAYLHSVHSDDEPSVNRLSRSYELQWCARANEMGLSRLALDCIKRNSHDLYLSETLPWVEQQVLALRAMGLQRGDTQLLHKALSTAETNTPTFRKHCSPDTVLSMNKLILQLNYKLKSLSTEKLKSLVEDVTHILNTRTTISQNTKANCSAIYELAMTYHDDMWDETTATSDQDKLLSDMADALGRALHLGLPRSDSLLAVALNRLGEYGGPTLSDGTAKKLLVHIEHLLPTLDDFSMEHLKTHRHLFPSRLRGEFSFMSERDDEHMSKYRRCFELVCDAEYALLQYCDLLTRALRSNDEDEWKTVFDRMKHKMFDNPYAGSDYDLLARHRNKLYEIRDYDHTLSFKTKAEQTLKDIFRVLVQRTQNVLRLSQLCPALTQDDGAESERDRCLGKLLGLLDKVTVVRFDEQVSVFVDSLRRPALLRALLSTGARRRYLHKSGEALRADAAAQRVLGACGASGAYSVTPLSADCGLIEFLEEHERLRSLICSSHDLDAAAAAVQRTADRELVLSPAPALLHQHHQLSDKVPAHALRAAIERASASVQDFIAKRQRFLHTVASGSLLTWILGLGDRHLQNILYSLRDGGACCADWNALFQYGGSGAELPPARLTRNILAVCDTQALESRLQSLLSELRDQRRLLLPVLRISFQWMGAEFREKYAYMESILSGRARSYDVTRAALHAGAAPYKEQYVQLLDGVFQEWETRDQYSVEEQVACLLRQCTDPRVLSVTRAGWEPWV